MSKNRVALTCLLAAATSGCGNLRAIHHGTELAGGQRSYFIDAQQRAIISADALESGQAPITCTEPSPDAMSALAASASTNLSRDDLGQLQASFAMSESAANIGLRTPTIQLLRDGMYRLCESYMNGAITSDNYLVLINRYQQMMIGLVAIEQLTGTVRTANTQIGGQAALASSSVELLSVAERNLRQIQARRVEIDSRLAQLDSQNIPEAGSEEPSAQAQADREERTAERTRLSAERETVIAEWRRQTEHITTLTNLRAQTLAQVEQASVTAAQRTGEGQPQVQPANLSGDNLAAVATAVQTITREITNNNLPETACMPAYFGPRLRGEGTRGLDSSQFERLLHVCLNMAQKRIDAAPAGKPARS